MSAESMISSSSTYCTIDTNPTMLNSLEMICRTNQLRYNREITNKMDNESQDSEHCLIIQNFILIWLDSNLNDADKHFTQLRLIANEVNIFTDVDRCIDFLTEIKDTKAFMIVACALSEQLISVIHEIPQLYSIYIFCEKNTQQKVLPGEWTKVKGLFTEIEPIYSSLKQDTRQCDHSLDFISLVPPGDYSKKNLNELPPLFMYSQILKAIS